MGDAKRLGRIADELAGDGPARAWRPCSSPTPRPPRSAGDRVHPFADLGRRAAEAAHHADRRGRRGGDLLHVGDHGPAQGRDLHPPRHDRQPPEHGDEHHRRLDGRRAPPPSAPRAAARPSACSPRRCSTWPAATRTWWSSLLRRGADRDARGPLRPGGGAAPHRGREGEDLGHRAHHGVAGLRAPRPPRLRHHLGAHHGLRRVAVGRRAPAQGAGDVPQRAQRVQRLRAHRVVVGGDRAHRRRRAGAPRVGGPGHADGRRPHRRRRRRLGARRGHRRGVPAGADHHARLLGQARGHRRGRSGTAGSTPATWATSTRTACSTSPTGPRT